MKGLTMLSVPDWKVCILREQVEMAFAVYAVENNRLKQLIFCLLPTVRLRLKTA